MNKKSYGHDIDLRSFEDYCEKMGVQLLKEDVSYIRNRLSVFSPIEHRKILHEYVKYWLRMMGECECKTSAQNFGRRNANMWLRSAKRPD